MLASARDAADNPIEVVAVFDEDDKTRGQYDLTDVKHVSVPHRHDMAGLWNVAYEYASGDILMMCGDDVTFETPGWDSTVEMTFDEVPDGVLMVYGNDGSPRQAPTLPFVSRKWVEQAGEFTDEFLQGWFADEWIWSIAAELQRVVYLPDVVFRHEQRGDDATYRAGQKRRMELGGLEGMRRSFYAPDEVERRDQRVARLRLIMDRNVEVVSPEMGEWYEQSREWARIARATAPNPRTLIVVHCWAGDKELVEDSLRVHLRHKRPILVLSPEDSPVEIEDPVVTNYSAGKRGYFGQDSLDRQRLHLEHLLTLEYDYFLLNDADSLCLAPNIPSYLYLPENQGVLWSNEVRDWRTHPTPYPRIALQPPYFMHRSVIEKLLTQADSPAVEAHPITPYIDWYMLALAEEAGVEHRTFPDGASFPAWRRDEIAETQQLGHDYKHPYVADGKILGDVAMRGCVRNGAVFLHSIKHKPVLDMLVAEYDSIHGLTPQTAVQRISVLVPLRPEKSDVARTRAWKWVERWWRDNIPDVEICVAEDDGTEPFSKTQAVNNAYKKATGDVFVVADADSFMEPEPLKNAIRVARQTARLVVPWRQVIRLSEQDTKTQLRRRKSAIDRTADVLDRCYETPVPETAGTLFVIRRDAFERVQGMDPRFRGWGHEDVAFARACHTLLGPTMYGPDDVISLYHPRPEGKTGRVWDNDDGNRNLPLAQAYVLAYQHPWKMQQLVDEHPLGGRARRHSTEYEVNTEAMQIREQLDVARDDSIRVPLDA
jgi:glycosyltransferase involved in cell wall biosynthesis